MMSSNPISYARREIPLVDETLSPTAWLTVTNNGEEIVSQNRIGITNINPTP